MKNNINKSIYIKTAVIIFIIAAVWFVLDRFTKIYFDSGQFSLGQNITDSFLGIFHLTLVHNTGAAFGIFSNSTILLAFISIIVSIFLLSMPFIHLFRLSKNKSKYSIKFMHLLCVSVIVAGGLGNAIDRIVTGYVVDFICFDFIDFPVFNIADIGVTCGIIMLVLVMIFNMNVLNNKRGAND